MKRFFASIKRAFHLGRRPTPPGGYDHLESSTDGDHYLRKQKGDFFLGYDNGRDLREWKLQLPKEFDEELLWSKFSSLTGQGAGRFEFADYLLDSGVVLEESDWW